MNVIYRTTKNEGVNKDFFLVEFIEKENGQRTVKYGYVDSVPSNAELITCNDWESVLKDRKEKWYSDKTRIYTITYKDYGKKSRPFCEAGERIIPDKMRESDLDFIKRLKTGECSLPSIRHTVSYVDVEKLNTKLLTEQLEIAVENEDYKTAARLRDLIKGKR